MTHMMVRARSLMEIDLADLAKSLTRDPTAFADFWFAFADEIKRNPISLEAFGEAMASPLGSMRQEPFTAIIDHMKHFIHKRKEPPARPAGQDGDEE